MSSVYGNYDNFAIERAGDNVNLFKNQSDALFEIINCAITQHSNKQEIVSTSPEIVLVDQTSNMTKFMMFIDQKIIKNSILATTIAICLIIPIFYVIAYRWIV